MDSQFAKILKLIKLTGEKVVVLKDDQEFVVTNLDDYFRLIEGTQPITELSEGQMLDKINRDIALWRESQQEFFTKTDDAFEVVDDSRPYYTPLRHSAQAEIDKLNDDIDNEMLSIKNNQDFVQNPFSNEATLDKFKFNSDFEENKDYTDSNEDLVDINDINFSDDESWDDESDTNNDSNIEDTPIWGKVSDLNNEDDNIEAKHDVYEDEDFTWEDELPNINSVKENKKNITKPKVKRPRVNNFGYLNPSDTEDEENNTQSFEKEEFNAANFDDIPPPPDMKNS